MGLGPFELVVIAGVIILLFGSAQLPKLARSLGNFINEFNDAKDNGSKKKTGNKKKKAAKKKAA